MGFSRSFAMRGAGSVLLPAPTWSNVDCRSIIRVQVPNNSGRIPRRLCCWAEGVNTRVGAWGLDHMSTEAWEGVVVGCVW